MRTEQLLRDTLDGLADDARTPEVAWTRIMAQVPTRPAKRRRTVALVVAAVVLLALAVAVPTILVNRTPEPVGRVTGNWNLTHRVELPPGWEAKRHLISTDSEESGYGEVGIPNAICEVRLYVPGRGDPTAARPDRTPVTVQGRPGSWADDSDITSTGLTWEYQPDAFAWVSCTPGDGTVDLATDVAFAERVRFETVPVRLPFRLRSLPRGYEGDVVLPMLTSSTEGSPAAAQFRATDEGRQPQTVGIVVNPGRTEIPPGLAGWETETIGGRPAVLSARDARLCLNLERHTACIEASAGDPADLTTSLWAEGRREVLVDVAERLVLAEDLDDQNTWFPANRALSG